MIWGINASSFIDYPGEISFVIFTGGCNFLCPYCHNGDLVKRETMVYNEEEVIAMLKERQTFITAVTITGGEPTIHGNNLIALIKRIKELGFKIKLDTNGSNPNILEKIIDQNLVDYLAMDIKNTFSKYNLTTGVNIDVSKIQKSINLIENSQIDYMLRTTINKEMHTFEDLEEIYSYLKKKDNFVIQSYRYSKEQIKDIDYGSFLDTELKEIEDKLKVKV